MHFFLNLNDRVSIPKGGVKIMLKVRKKTELNFTGGAHPDTGAFGAEGFGHRGDKSDPSFSTNQFMTFSDLGAT